MSKTSPSSWKRRERNAAALFGSKRKLLSGSAGREGETRSDSTHSRLFIEAKLRSASAVRTLWEDTAAKAKKEGKTPVAIVYTKHKHGALIVVHEKDFDKIVAERMRVFIKDHDLKPLAGILTATDWADLMEASEVVEHDGG